MTQPAAALALAASESLPHSTSASHLSSAPPMPSLGFSSLSPSADGALEVLPYTSRLVADSHASSATADRGSDVPEHTHAADSINNGSRQASAGTLQHFDKESSTVAINSLAAPPQSSSSSSRVIHASVGGEHSIASRSSAGSKKSASMKSSESAAAATAISPNSSPAASTSTASISARPAVSGKAAKQISKAAANTEPVSSMEAVQAADASSLPLSELSTLVAHVECLRMQNQQLQESMAEKDKNVSQLSKALVLLQEQSSSSASSSDQGNSVDVSKELSKRNRELSVQLAKERREYESQLQQLRAAANQTINHHGRASTTGSTSASSQQPQMQHRDNELADLSKQLASSKKAFADVNTQLIDSRRLMDVQKDQTRRWMKIAQREVGDDNLTLESAECSASAGKQAGWKARAEQISLLQSKLQEARRHLATLTPTTNNGAAGEQHTSDSKYNSLLSSKKLERHMDNAVLQSELQQCKSQLEDYRMRFDACKARVSVLDSEQRELRGKMTLLLQKGDNDNKVIQSLREQINLQQVLAASASASASDPSNPASPSSKKLTAVKQRYEALLKAAEEEIARLKHDNLALRHVNHGKLQAVIDECLASTQHAFDTVQQQSSQQLQQELSAVHARYNDALQQIHELSSAVIALDQKRVLQEKRSNAGKAGNSKLATNKAEDNLKTVQHKLQTAEALLKLRDDEVQQLRRQSTLHAEQRREEARQMEQALASMRLDVDDKLQVALKQFLVE